MAGIKLAGAFLIAGMLLTGQVWAEGDTNPSIAGDETAARPDAPAVPADAATVIDGASSAGAADQKTASDSRAEAVKTAAADVKTDAVPKVDASPQGGAPSDDEEALPPGIEKDEVIEEETIADPIEPWNRMMFQFNDKLYFWGLKPVAKGYNAVVPEPVRISVNNFFKNGAMPVRLINALLQGKLKTAGTELARFGINTCLGLVGFLDVARNDFDIYEQNEDLGQTLGIYGLPPMMYIVWPFIGPSTVRDTIGQVGDSFLDVSNYVNPFYIPLGIHAYDKINKQSLDLTSYEDMKKSSVEPYTAIRDAYVQYRKGLLKK